MLIPMPILMLMFGRMLIDANNTNLQNLKKKLRLRKLCWETMFGQELVSYNLNNLSHDLDFVFKELI